MKRRVVALLMATMMGALCITGCGSSKEATSDKAAKTEKEADTESDKDADKKAADKVAALIDAIYVQERNDKTDEQCAEAKEAWDALTDAQKELVEGENADPDYFGRDTGDASKDDARNQDDIGENEILAVSFGTSFNDSRVADIKGIEDALQEANPDWSVRRAFTAQIIINHVQARDGEKIDNVDQALERAVDNGVKNLVVQPTHLMRGAEYDELVEAVENYKDKFETVKIAEPLLGEVGADADAVNSDKEAVAKALTAEAVKDAGYDSLDAAAEDSTAFVFMGHGTSHTAKISYSQMQAQMEQLGYKNVFIGTVEGEPEDTECQAVIEKVKEEAAMRNLSSAVISFRTHPQQVLHPEIPFRMLTSPEERAELLRKTGIDRTIFLDFTPEMSLLSAYDFLKILSNRYCIKGLIIGYDHRFGHNRAEGFEEYVKYGKDLGIEIIHAPEFVTDLGPVSSSIIRKYLLQGDVCTANRLLSYPYTLHGNVVKGFQVGRKIGFPTANLTIDYPDKLIPANGVYAVRIGIPDGKHYEGMLNIGHRPTLNRPNDYSIEVNIFNFSEDLYGKTLSVELIEYVRTEKTFADIKALQSQLVKDKETIRKILSE